MAPQTRYRFSETAYGIVKRVDVFRGWIEWFKEETGKSRICILDFGCGNGEHLTIPLGVGGDEILGIDSHELSVQAARNFNGHSNVEFSTQSLDSLLEENRQFDIVICSEVLEHTSDPSDILKKLNKLQAPQGVALVSVPNGYGSFEYLRRIEKVLGKFGIQPLLSRAHRGLRKIKKKVMQLGNRAEGLETAEQLVSSGSLNFESRHIQFFRFEEIGALFASAGYERVESRSRTVLCGPFVDSLFYYNPFRQCIYSLNNRFADWLPLSWTSDWMFLLRKV